MNPLLVSLLGPNNLRRSNLREGGYRVIGDGESMVGSDSMVTEAHVSSMLTSPHNRRQRWHRKQGETMSLKAHPSEIYFLQQEPTCQRLYNLAKTTPSREISVQIQRAVRGV